MDKVGWSLEARRLGQVGRGSHEHVPVPHEWSDNQAAFRLRPNPEGDIHLILDQVKVLVSDQHFDRDLRMASEEAIQQGDHQDFRQARRCREPKRSRRIRLSLIQRSLRPVQGIKDLLAVLQELATGLGWTDSPRGPFQKPNPELTLQGADLPAEGRHRNARASRCFREAAVLDDSREEHHRLEVGALGHLSILAT